MSRTAIRRTPGVYITERDAFQASIHGVETAVPAFIGYTQKAEHRGESVLNKPMEIRSMLAFEAIFGGPPPKQKFKLSQLDKNPDKPDGYLNVHDPTKKKDTYWKLTPTPVSPFRLYDSMRLFYAKGGGRCFVVSVGGYSTTQIAFRDATNDGLANGLAAIEEQHGPTMLVVPDGVSLPNDPKEGSKDWHSSQYRRLVRGMLGQCNRLQDRVAVLDVYGSEYATSENLGEIIKRFREDAGVEGLNYGMAYFPFLLTSLSSNYRVTFLDLISNMNEEAGLKALKKILGWENINANSGGDAAPDKGQPEFEHFTKVQAAINTLKASYKDEEELLRQVDQLLTATLPVLGRAKTLVATKIRADSKGLILPPSAAMAGVYSFVDSDRGVWHAPANVLLQEVRAPSFQLTSKQQEDLNVPSDGKAIDAIREFTGRGTVVWGARTLAGNSPDWRYIQVRRTMIYVQQSIQAALEPFVFRPNTPSTWSTVVSMVSSFLQDLWSQGGLMGSTAQEAFTVKCGEDITMTATDILAGYMIVQVELQMVRPAEFIELIFSQKMEGVSG